MTCIASWQLPVFTVFCFARFCCGYISFLVVHITILSMFSWVASLARVPSCSAVAPHNIGIINQCNTKSKRNNARTVYTILGICCTIALYLSNIANNRTGGVYYIIFTRNSSKTQFLGNLVCPWHPLLLSSRFEFCTELPCSVQTFKNDWVTEEKQKRRETRFGFSDAFSKI